MKTLATAFLCLALAVPAAAATIWDEGTNGDLSTDPATPTLITFAPGSNTIIGSVSGTPLDRDYITFTIPAGKVLTHLWLHTWDPDDYGFSAFNAGSTGLVPSGATNASFLSGIHLSGGDVGMDLMVFFNTRKVTTNALPQPQLGPGTYCWMVQQLGPFVESYEMEFVFDNTLPTEPSTWGSVKALFR
jgi:hypothetical protein